jgi:trigger factor
MKIQQLLVISNVIGLFTVQSFRQPFRAVHLKSTLSATTGGNALYPDPTPGSPVMKNLDKETNVAFMSIALTGAQTQAAFAKSCDLFNEEVKTRGYKAAGFRPGAKLPPSYLYQMFGEDRVKLLCGTLLSEEIQDECEKTGMLFVGRGRITNFNEGSFMAGKEHIMEIECDLWPEINYTGDKGYKGLVVEAISSAIDMEKYEQVKQNIRERYKELTITPLGYAAQLGDVIVANMKGYEKNADGSKGALLPAVANGDGVEIVLEKGKFADGMIDNLVGALNGDTRDCPVKFPIRPTGPGAVLSGKEALFEVSVLAVKTKSVPAWDQTLAGRVREGMSLQELEDEVIQAIDGDRENSKENNRNDALAAKLLEITEVSRIPESLVDENTQVRFQQMLVDFKEQGSTDEQLQEMTSPENYNRYKEISRPNVNKIVKLGMAFRDIAEKEKCIVTDAEVNEQLDVIVIQAKQKGEQPPDEDRARDEIENVLLRKKVFDMLATHATITWIDPPKQAE